jgi:hypothetical protein
MLLFNLIMATPATTFYRQSIANRLDREPYRVSDFESFGIIRPEEDPGIVEGTFFFSPRVTNEQIVQLDKDAKSDREGFEQNYHLPKGVFSPEDQEFDSGKENLVINVTEDDEYWLKNPLEGLDNFSALPHKKETLGTK